MNAIKRYISLIIVFAFASGFIASAVSTTTIKAKLDSMVILMGKQTTLHYQIVQDKGANGYFFTTNPKLLSPNVEVIDTIKADTTDLGNNRIQIDRSLIIQSFDSGVWEIPAAKYVIGKDTVFSNKLNLKVIPVPIDTLKTIHDFKSVEKPPFNLFDYLPDFIVNYWWIYIIVIVLAVLGAMIYVRYKSGKPILMPKKKEIPPYEEALSALTQLKAEKLWQSGQEKEYFTALTDILRRYIDRRFTINAIEMTSSQIIDVLKKNDETKAVNEQLKQILEVADFVKFANMRPLPDDSEGALIKAMNFIEETKPVIEVQSVKNDSEDKDEPADSNKK